MEETSLQVISDCEEKYIAKGLRYQEQKRIMNRNYSKEKCKDRLVSTARS